MTSQANFFQLMRYGVSQASIGFNTNFLKGVSGMPTTHQIGFGRALREGIHPNSIDIRQMENEVHARMGVLGIGVYVTQKNTESNPWSALLTGGVSFYVLRQMYLDWKAGFVASTYLDKYYWEKFEKHGASAYYKRMF